MTLQELEAQLVLQEQRALDLTLVSQDRLRREEVRAAWTAARALEMNLRCHGEEAQGFVSRLSSVMVELLCAEERIRPLPRVVTAA